MPTPEELEKLLVRTQKEERNQRALLHLLDAMARSEIGPNRPPRPLSRVRLVANVLRLLESRKSCDIHQSIAAPTSQRDDELWSLNHDALSESRDRYYRCLRMFC